MRGSLSLSLYRVFQPKAAERLDGPAKKLDAPVIWAAVQDRRNLRAVLTFAHRLRLAEPDMQFLITTTVPLTDVAQDLPAWIVIRPMPGERAAETREFLTSWKPDVGLWVGGELRPAVILEAQEAGVPMTLLNARAEAVQVAANPARRRLVRHCLQGFHRVLVSDPALGGMVLRQGVAEDRVEVLGRLQEEPLTLPVDLLELDQLASYLSGRQLWLATNVKPEEIDVVLEAHRVLRRTNRRLMLILDPAVKSDGEALCQSLTDQGWRAVRRGAGAIPEESTQIYLADMPGEMGLWYRLAPITFMGGTLSARGQGLDPTHPAALGSAVIHGGRRDPFREQYDRLHQTKPPAARSVVNATGLVQAVTSLLSPDEAALLAHAAWDMVSQGAEVTNRLIALVSEALDNVGVPDA